MKLHRLIPSCTAADDQIYVKLMCVLKNFAVPLLFTSLFLLDVSFFSFFLCARLASLQLPSASQTQLLCVLAGQTIRRPAAAVACSQVAQHWVTARRNGGAALAAAAAFITSANSKWQNEAATLPLLQK